jgi:VWA domain-containing protein/aerotolerance regulator-like protein
VSLLFPLGMAALGALVPLLALYLLKQKRVEQKVPANFLWARAVEDLRASSLFQRLRATLLLLLQAAAIALFAFAAAGASLDLDLGSAPRHVIVLLDRSASMKSADEADGRTRFDVARELALTQADGLSAADEMMVVAFDVHAEVVAAFTGDKPRLAQAIRGLAARDLPTKVADALMLAVSFAQASKGFDCEILLLSDGAVEAELPPVPYPVKFVRLGKPGANAGVTSLQVARLPGEATQVFAKLENAGTEAVERTVVLARGGETLDARAVALPARGSATAFFELPEGEGKDARVFSVALQGRDALAADDRVEFVIRPFVPRAGLLVAEAPSIYLDPAKVERLHPGLALTQVTPDQVAEALRKGGPAIDFICYDGVEPKELPPVAAQLYIDSVPPGSGLVRGAAQQFPIVIDWDRTHPATARCQFDDLLVSEAPKLSGFERSRVLIDSTGGPLALLTPVPGREVVVLAFAPAKSNFPLKLSWPLFLANTLDFLLGKTERAGEEPVARTGEAMLLGSGESARVTTPSGDAADVAPGASGRLAFAATFDAGVYRAKVGDAPEQLRAYALLDGAESDVAPRDQLVLGGDKVAGTDRPTQRNVLLRDPLLLAALGILILEWALWCSRR